MKAKQIKMLSSNSYQVDGSTPQYVHLDAETSLSKKMQ